MPSETIKKADVFIAATYKRLPVVLTRGEGCTLWDESGRAYLDFVAGIAVCNLGHAHPAVTLAVAEQAARLVHVSNLFYTQPQADVAALLVENSFADRVFFCNSGAEANEAAIKLARKYFYEKGDSDRFRIVAMDKSFHGRTMATLSATGQEKIRKGFDPVLGGFDFVPFNDITGLKAKLDYRTAAVLLEPIQGEGGVRCPSAGYLEAVRALCNETGTLLIFDEIQTGMGRTGRLFAYEHFGIEPDIMTLAKALANGLPMGAMLAREQVAEAFGPGSHATTFGGTPLVTAASHAVLRQMLENDIPETCRKAGAYFFDRLLQLKERHPIIEEVRGLGLLLGLKLAVDAEPVVLKCLERGFLINWIQGDILRFVPPLIVTIQEIDRMIDCLDDVLTDLVRGERTAVQ
ncbi:MAG: acetylornithine transaminase [Desulfobacterales bacterium]|jgi:acetylornithine/N-succinyldiaminopimelate aminotransferase